MTRSLAVCVLCGYLSAGAVPHVSFAQDRAEVPSAQTSGAAGLSPEEAQAFDARLRAARTDADRAQIQGERDRLIEARGHRPAASIPPSPRELSQDPVMPDVPTPPLARPGASGNTLPGGALSDTGAGTSPAINPGSSVPPGR